MNIVLSPQSETNEDWHFWRTDQKPTKYNKLIVTAPVMYSNHIVCSTYSFYTMKPK